MYKQTYITLALISFILSLALTALGGWADILGTPFTISKQHAWNDGIFMMLIAIFLLLLAKL